MNSECNLEEKAKDLFGNNLQSKIFNQIAKYSQNLKIKILY